MLTVDQIYSRAGSWYSAFLRSVARGEKMFPLTLAGGGMARLTDFTRDQAAIAELRAASREVRGFGYVVEWKQKTSRRFGAQRIPAAVSIPTREDYTRLLGKCEEVRVFEQDYRLIAARAPELCSWAETYPHRVVEHAGLWPELLAVCEYLRLHGPVQCYPRELPVCVDTKFIGRHETVLNELLPLAAPGSVSQDCTTFESRFGFRRKQLVVRFRLLDPAMKARLGVPFCDFGIPLDAAAELDPPVDRVVIVENEMTFLTLPPLPGTLAILGAGYCVATLGTIQWLSSIATLYWGDMDAHGYAALSHLRQAHGHVDSILMDLATLERFRRFTVPASAYAAGIPSQLNAGERAAFDVVHSGALLLEQERIPHADATIALRRWFEGL